MRCKGVRQGEREREREREITDKNIAGENAKQTLKYMSLLIVCDK